MITPQKFSASKPAIVGGLWGFVVYTYVFLRMNASGGFDDVFTVHSLWMYLDGLIASSGVTSTLSHYYQKQPDITL